VSEVDQLRAEVEGLEADRDHYRSAAHRQLRIIAGLRRAVVVLQDWKRGRLGCGDRTEYSMYLSVRDRAWDIRAAAKHGDYRHG